MSRFRPAVDACGSTLTYMAEDSPETVATEFLPDAARTEGAVVAWSDAADDEVDIGPVEDFHDEADTTDDGERQPWNIAWGSASALVLISVLVAVLLAVGLQIAKSHGAFTPSRPEPTLDNTLPWTTIYPPSH
jgi:hypothetical protein